jgi:hypothetical protein
MVGNGSTSLCAALTLMESQLSEEALWAVALAARLRVLQANFADDDAATRQSFLVEEIERALKGCVPDTRRVLLDALAVRFPSFESGGSLPDPKAKAPAAPPAPLTPEELLQRLLDAIPKMSGLQRSEMTEKFANAGVLQVVVSEKSGGGFETPPELQKRLALAAGQSVNADRAGKTLAMLLDMVLTMDQLVWTLWKQIAPKSMVRREADLAKLSGEYLIGSNEVSSAQVQQTVEKTRKMIAGLLGAVGRAGGSYARERARLFDPSAIEADSRSEKKWNESVEFACWRKYVQLSKEYGAEPVIEKGIQEAVAKAAENLIMGRPAS